MRDPHEPKTKQALLASAGVLPGVLLLTEHNYVRTDVVPDPMFGTLRASYLPVFRCAVTGAERTWGCEGMSTPDETSPLSDGPEDES